MKKLFFIILIFISVSAGAQLRFNGGKVALYVDSIVSNADTLNFRNRTTGQKVKAVIKTDAIVVKNLYTFTDTFTTSKVFRDSIAELREDIGTGGDCKLNVNTSISNQLSNLYSTANIYSFCNTDAVTYAWTGPSIVGSITTKNIIINEPGLYRAIASKVGCSSDTSEIYVNTIQWTETSMGIKYDGGSGDSICIDNTGAIRNYVGGVLVYELKSNGSIWPKSIKADAIVDTFIRITFLDELEKGYFIKTNYGSMSYILNNHSVQNEMNTNYNYQNYIYQNETTGHQNIIYTNDGIQSNINNNTSTGTAYLISTNTGTGLNFTGTGKHIRLFSTSAADTANVQKRASTGIHVAYLNASNVTTTKIDYEGNITTTGQLKAGQIPAALTDGTPTAAEVTAAIGFAPSVAGAGFQITIKDNNGTGLLYKIESDGTDWYCWGGSCNGTKLL